MDKARLSYNICINNIIYEDYVKNIQFFNPD